ncbi:MAG: M36 family metallopeptidase, partial [Planctomycetes bacterium]|nr:M36 family metallopeptidase [Planctomycetota bacterium]
MHILSSPRSLALLLALPSAALAQAGIQQSNPIEQAWQKFLAQNGPGWTAHWNQATGTPKAIFGTGLRVADELISVDAARPHAEGVLNRHAALLGRGGSQFVEVSSSQVRHLYYFIYKQQYQGLDVLDARADVRIHDSGVVAMFGAAAVPIPGDFLIKPAFGGEAARTVAHQEVLGQQGKADAAQPKLIIWAQPYAERPTKPVLAWQVQIDQRPQTLTVGKAFVDATTGAFLEFRNEVFSCASCGKNHVTGYTHAGRDRLDRAMERAATLRPTAPAGSAPKLALTGTVMAWTNTGHKPTDTLVNIPLKNLKVTSSAGTAYTDNMGVFTIPYTGTTNVVVSATLEGLHTQRVGVSQGTQLTASASISPTTGGTIQFGTQTMGETDFSQTSTYYFTDDVNTWVRTLIPTKTTEMAKMDTIAPRVNIPSSCNAYYTGYTINFYSSSATCNMTAYETVVYHEWGHGLDDVFGGINTRDGLSEGWADVLAILLSKQEILGPGFYKTQTPDYVRIATNTKTYPTSGGTHTQGEVWMGWVWDVRLEMIKKYGTQLGPQITEQIVVPTIVANSVDMQQQILEVFLLDDNDANLKNGTPNYLQLEPACIKRTVPYPKIDAAILTHTPLKGTAEQLTPRIVLATAVPTFGTVTKVELVYDVGSGAQRLEMVPSGKTDEYIALLPGVLSPVDVGFYIEATHSSSKVLRSPEVGTYQYSIGKEDVFFFDDFETVTPGWTSGPLLGTQNDFVRGNPTGARGTTWGVAWNDPPSAFSGTNCWGNNHAGAYSPTAARYLRTPKLDLTGKTNVKLRFMRWLQVQDGRYDVAKVSLNGTQIWSNPWGT